MRYKSRVLFPCGLEIETELDNSWNLGFTHIDIEDRLEKHICPLHGVKCK
jgi:hypothetical protein